MENDYCAVLGFALELEKRGEKLYRELAQKVVNKFSIKTLRFLAGEELKHIEKIEKFNEALLKKGKLDIDSECQSTLPERLNTFLKDFAKKKSKGIKVSDSDIEVYEVALDMERESYDFYEDAYNENDDEALKKFFKFLMGEEKKHYALLEASKKYLADPSYYFEEMGGEIFG